MQSPQESNCGHPNRVLVSQYDHLKRDYLNHGITFKSNEIIHKVSNIRGYPYHFVLDIVKLFHMNQFETLFFSHILHDQEIGYLIDPQLFTTNMNMPDFTKIYNKLTNNGLTQIRVIKQEIKVQILEQEQQENSGEMNYQKRNIEYWSLHQLKKLYVYLLVIAYSIKYYLNESTKAYEDQIKKKYPEFFSSIFNTWVDKYSNKVLRTNPRKINQFYVDLFQAEENPVFDNQQIDLQYRNYNEIVEQLIKATSDADEGHEEIKDFPQS